MKHKMLTYSPSPEGKAKNVRDILKEQVDKRRISTREARLPPKVSERSGEDHREP